MENWNFLIPSGRLFSDFAVIGGLFLLGMLVRRHLPLLKNNLVPVNIIAGTLGLFLGSNGVGFFQLDGDRMGVYVYHLLALTFIAVSLSTGNRKLGRGALVTGFVLIGTYVAQGIGGLALAFAIKYTVFPDLFLGFGLLLPLGFGMGPGIAFSISRNWEQFGFLDGGTAGLTLSSIGFLWAYIVGMWIMRKGIRDGRSQHISSESSIPDSLKSGFIPVEQRSSAGNLTTPTEVIETLTVHFGVIGLVYLLTIWTVTGLEWMFQFIGAQKEISTLWSFHFIISSVVAIAFRKIMNAFQLSDLLDNDILLRVANLFVDFMLAASLIAISLTVALYYWIPLLLISTAGGIITYFSCRYAANNWYEGGRFERFLAIFGNSTGTIQSGLVLLRVVDPDFKSGAADDLVYGSGVALGLGLPLLVLINAPVNFFDGKDYGYLIVMGALFVYWLFLFGVGRWKFLRNPNG